MQLPYFSGKIQHFWPFGVSIVGLFLLFGMADGFGVWIVLALSGEGV